MFGEQSIPGTVAVSSLLGTGLLPCGNLGWGGHGDDVGVLKASEWKRKLDAFIVQETCKLCY